MVCNKFPFRCNNSEMYEMFWCCNLWAHLRVSVVCWSWNSVAFIEASLEELPVSANFGQSCLATKIGAPGPSSFGWFRHSADAPPRKKLQTSVTVFGCFQLVTASTFTESTATPSSDNMCPRKAIFVSQNSHLLNLAYSLCTLNFSKTTLRCCSCS